jgi:FkbH-like protein
VTLNEALTQIKGQNVHGEKKVHFLACGFQPLHLGTFLHAHLVNRSPAADRVELLTGLYGDLRGNLKRAAESSAIGAAVVIEWADIDPRLGLRSSGNWSSRSVNDVVSTFEASCQQIEAPMRKLAECMPVAVAPPGLPLPHIGSTIRAQSSVVELELRQHLAAFLTRLAQIPGVRIVDSIHLERLSPSDTRLDVKMELLAGFPFSLTYTDALAGSLVDVLYQSVPKKGLITDLDNTLWAGIVGEIGPDAISWQQESHSQIHGLYQQLLGHLADCGVLLAVSSKNELAVVQKAMERKDFFFDPQVLFPIRADWGPKSRAVEEILRTWNISADSVVFVDDNPLDLAEVKQSHSGITCLQFHPKDPAKVWTLLGELRNLFGKPVVLEEDRLRGLSIRSTTRIHEARREQTSAEFLQGLEGVVTVNFNKNPADMRSLELINKTNQFNLNGLRLSEGEWKRCLAEPENLALAVSYEDKFGPLGKIAVLLAQQSGKRVKISHWVLSCRAFSRHIEYHTLDALFRHTNAEEIELAFEPTERNQPLQEFIGTAGIRQDSSGAYLITPSDFQPFSAALPHRVSYLD